MAEYELYEPEAPRGFLAVKGRDAKAFLQGLITNDIARLDGFEATQLLYAGLLTPQGKLITDFFLFKGEKDGYVIDVPLAHLSALQARLSLYKLRSDVVLAPLELWLACGFDAARPDDAMLDPRHGALGWRIYRSHPFQTPPAAFDWPALRVAHLIPQMDQEMVSGGCFPLEYGFERLNGVDFKKGCYVGQEVTARMKHKTVLRKGLVQLEIIKEADGVLGPAAPVLLEGREIGQITTRAGRSALAYLRHDRVDPGAELQAAGASVRLSASG